MSPVAGVGINLAIQDAVCTANVLAGHLRSQCNADPQLHRVAARRMLPTRMVQRAQQFAHVRLLEPVISGLSIGKAAPWPIRLLDRHPTLRRIPGRLIGLGIRREHVRSPVG